MVFRDVTSDGTVRLTGASGASAPGPIARQTSGVAFDANVVTSGAGTTLIKDHGTTVTLFVECQVTVGWAAYIWVLFTVPEAFWPARTTELSLMGVSGGSYPCMLNVDGTVVSRVAIPDETIIVGCTTYAGVED